MKKQLDLDRKMSPTKKDRESSEVVSSMDASRAVNEPKSVIDMSKFVAILELCLSEKLFELNPKRILAEKVSQGQSNQKLDLLQKFRKACFVGLTLIISGTGEDIQSNPAQSRKAL